MSDTAMVINRDNLARPVAATGEPVRNAIEVRNLNFFYGKFQGLKDINLDIQEKRVTAFIGPSGCGKTTFLRVIADLEKHTAGEITVNGMTPEEARKARSYGYVFQAAALYPWRTIENNIALPLEIMGYSAAEKKKRIEQTLELVNLSGFAKKYPWQLSGGMQQRASIARALSVEDLRALMDISEPLARLNRDRFAAFKARPAPDAVKPAAFCFDGDTYAGLEARTMDPDALRWAQGHLRIHFMLRLDISRRK